MKESYETGITEDDIRASRRRAEDRLRKAIILLIRNDLLDEADDLCFRLEREVEKRTARYLRIAGKE